VITGPASRERKFTSRSAEWQVYAGFCKRTLENTTSMRLGE
jgi:hypothetical protein